MVYREVSVIEIREALRAWLAGKSERAVAAQAGVDRKTSKRYVTAGRLPLSQTILLCRISHSNVNSRLVLGWRQVT
jgi:hypothetical protein